MPNWCNNTIKISGTPKKIKVLADIIESIKDTRESNLFETLIGLPYGVSKEDYDMDWYNNNMNHFGCKWDVSPPDCDFEIDIRDIVFHPLTAWSPPIPFCDKLAVKYGVNVSIYYSEPGCDFAGIVNIKKDGTFEEDQYPYSKGMYILDKDVWWEELNSNIEYSLNENMGMTAEEYVKKYRYVSGEDIKSVIEIYNEIKEETLKQII